MRDDVFGFLLVSPRLKTLWHPEGVGGPVDQIFNTHQEYFFDGMMIDAEIASTLHPDVVQDLVNGTTPVLEIGYAAWLDEASLLDDTYYDEIPCIGGIVSGWGKRAAMDGSFFSEYMKPLGFYHQDHETILLRHMDEEQDYMEEVSYKIVLETLKETYKVPLLYRLPSTPI